LLDTGGYNTTDNNGNPAANNIKEIPEAVSPPFWWNKT